MPLYLYRCEDHGDFDEGFRADVAYCPCGKQSRRIWRLKIDAASARFRGRWDPQVGAYVSSEGQFHSLLAKGQDEQSAKLNMDVKLATVDARDNEGLAELHGWKPDDRLADLEGVKKAKRDNANK